MLTLILSVDHKWFSFSPFFQISYNNTILIIKYYLCAYLKGNEFEHFSEMDDLLENKNHPECFKKKSQKKDKFVIQNALMSVLRIF